MRSTYIHNLLVNDPEFCEEPSANLSVNIKTELIPFLEEEHQQL